MPASGDDGTLEAEKLDAYQQYHHGKAKHAITKLRSVIERTTAVADKVLLQRDLAEICVAAYDWRCVDESLSSIFQATQQNQQLSVLLPEARLYLIKELLWFNDYKSVERIVQGGHLRSPPQAPIFLP
jgi:hypothetical protein